MECKICKRTITEHLTRCSDHYRCDDCYTKEDHLMFRDNGLTCDSCHEKRVLKRVAEFEGYTYFTGEIICPWCGEEETDSWEYPDSEDDIECEHCGNHYTMQRDVEVSYSTDKLDS